MRQTSFLIICGLIGGIVPVQSALSADQTAPAFFMPQKALNPHYEKLPPIRVQPSQNLRPTTEQTYKKGQKKTAEDVQTAPTRPKRRIARYEVVDGYFVPVYEEVPQLAEDQSVAQDESVAKDQSVTQDQSVAPENPDMEAPQQEEVTLEQLPPPLQDNILPPKKDEFIPQPPQNITQAIETPKQIEIQAGEPQYRTFYNAYLADLEVFRQTGQFPENKPLQQTLERLKQPQSAVLFDETVQPKRAPIRKQRKS